MAKYVLLAFDSDAEADEFVQRFTDDVQYMRTGIYAFVRGVWKRPTKFCECIGGKSRGWTRGKKFGWWVCSLCHRPSAAWARGDAWYTALGVNLLPVNFDAPEYRGPIPINMKDANARLGGPLPEILRGK